MNTDLPIDRLDTLRSLRVKIGWTQEEAAQKLGVAPSTLRSWESDSSRIGFNDILNIERTYGVKHQFIFFGKESTFSELMRKSRGIA